MVSACSSGELTLPASPQPESSPTPESKPSPKTETSVSASTSDPASKPEVTPSPKAEMPAPAPAPASDPTPKITGSTVPKLKPPPKTEIIKIPVPWSPRELFVPGALSSCFSRTPRPLPMYQETVESLEYNGFTHLPVDFDTVFNVDPHTRTSRLMPFVNYYNTSHAEGPKKWYIYAPSDPLVKVYLPADAILREDGIRFDQGVQEESLNSEKVFVDMQAWFDVSPDIQVFYMHLSLRDAVKRKVDESPNGYAVFEAGTHIGYIHHHPWYSLDFGVEDKTHDSGQTDQPSCWWNRRANPLDYFNDELRQSILDGYRSVLDSQLLEGTTPYSDLEDSRSNINIPDTIWGVWYKDDLSDPFSDLCDWSAINFTNREFLHQETYWKVLQENPTLSGLFTEEIKHRVQGTYLYNGEPMGKNRFFMLSGDEKAGIARINKEWSDAMTFLKYKVSLNTESKFDDKLVVESFSSQVEAENKDFSAKAVTFRRVP